MDSAILLDEAADRPPGLDLERLWEELRSRFEDRGEGIAAALRVRRTEATRAHLGRPLR